MINKSLNHKHSGGYLWLRVRTNSQVIESVYLKFSRALEGVTYINISIR